MMLPPGNHICTRLFPWPCFGCSLHMKPLWSILQVHLWCYCINELPWHTHSECSKPLWSYHTLWRANCIAIMHPKTLSRPWQTTFMRESSKCLTNVSWCLQLSEHPYESQRPTALNMFKTFCAKSFLQIVTMLLWVFPSRSQSAR